MAHVASIRQQTSSVASARGGSGLLKIEDFLPYRLNVAATLVSQALSHRYGERYSIGVPEWRILVGEVMPNALGPVLALGTLIVGYAILLEASLSFLGLSSPDIVSWGRILSAGQRFLFSAWWLSVFPGLAIFVTVLAFNLLGDALGDILNPRRVNA